MLTYVAIPKYAYTCMSRIYYLFLSAHHQNMLVTLDLFISFAVLKLSLRTHSEEETTFLYDSITHNLPHLNSSIVPIGKIYFFALFFCS